MNVIESERLDEVEFETGDIILMSGEGGTCKFIRFFTRSQYDHVAVVYRCPHTNEAWLWEVGSCPTGCGAIITRLGSVPSAAHLVSAKQRILQQNSAFVRRIRFHDGPAGKNLHRLLAENMKKFIVANIGRSYSTDVVLKWNLGFRLTSTTLPIFEDEEEHEEDGWVCPQLVMETLTFCALGTHLKSSKEYLPRDFGNDTWHETEFVPEDHVSWDDPVQLIYDVRKHE